MPNVAQVLKGEMQRIARKEAKAMVTPIKKENARLRQQVKTLQTTIKDLQRGHKQTAKLVQPLKPETNLAEDAKTSRVRPTSKTMIALRQKFGMSQTEFGKLLNVGRITVARWEAQEGKLNLRQSARDAFACVQKLGAKAARAQLEALN